MLAKCRNFSEICSGEIVQPISPSVRDFLNATIGLTGKGGLSKKDLSKK
jgi:hypothetical protein